MENSSTSPPSQLSPTLWPPNAFSIVPTLLLAFGIVIAAFAGGAIGVGIALALGEPLSAFARPQISLGSAAMQLATYVPIVALIVVALPRVAHRSLAQLGLRFPRMRDVLFGVAGAVAMSIAVTLTALAQQSLVHRETEQEVVGLFRHAPHGAALDLFIVTAVAIAPFVEELVFRGFIFNALLRRMPFAAAAILSGLLFGAVHGDIFFIVPLAAGGVVLAWVYYTSGTLSSSMISHALFNTVNVVGIFLTHAPAKT